MDISELLDSEVIMSPAYWFLTAGAIIAIIIGYNLQKAWGEGLTMPIISFIVTIALVPIISYLIVLKFKD